MTDEVLDYDKVKDEATVILKDLGLNMSIAINMFLVQVVKRRGIPFEVTNLKLSKDTLEALEKVKEIINYPNKYPRYTNRVD